MKEFVTIGYTYDELNDQAKEKVKQWYLENEIRNDIFYEDICEYLNTEFPNSELKVDYSLSYCQGDGLNIYGTLNLYDFLDKWQTGEKEKRTIQFYIDQAIYKYTFERNNHYCYSCKFIDKKYINDSVCEWIDELKYQQMKNINEELITQFYTDMINYFEELDNQFEKDGYKYLYDCDDEEVKECCEANDYYFTETGEFIG